MAGSSINLRFGCKFTFMVIFLLREGVGSEDCTAKFSRVGCYKDSLINPRPLLELLMTDRDVTSHAYSGKKIDWKNWNEYLPDLACRCAEKTRDKGYNIFGLQFYGECWSDFDGEERYFRDGSSNQCLTHDFVPCEPEDKYCVGKKAANFVYALNDMPTTPTPPTTKTPTPPTTKTPSVTKPTLKKCLKVCSRCPVMCPKLQQQPPLYHTSTQYPNAGCPAICSTLCVSGNMADVSCEGDCVFH